MSNETNKGRIFFKSEVKWDTAYKVEDNKSIINGFLYSKLSDFGFITSLDSIDLDLEKKKKIKVIDTELPADIRYAVVGNISGVFDMHKSKMIESLSAGKDIWVSITLLQEFLKLIKKEEFFDGVEIIIEDKYNKNMILQPTKKSISILLGLFGKFYGKKMDRRDSKVVGNLEEDILNRKLTSEEIDMLIGIVTIQENRNTMQLPQVNLFSKLKEALIEFKALTIR